MKSGFGSSERWSGTTRNGRFLEFFKQWGFHQQSPKQTHTDILYVSIGVVPNGFLDIDLASWSAGVPFLFHPFGDQWMFQGLSQDKAEGLRGLAVYDIPVAREWITRSKRFQYWGTLSMKDQIPQDQWSNSSKQLRKASCSSKRPPAFPAWKKVRTTRVL